MISLVKISLRLLLRSKGFLFFLLVTPALSALILGIKLDYNISGADRQKEAIKELKGYKEKAVYIGDNSQCIVKVYDGSHSGLSEYLLEQMAESGMFCICRCDVRSLTEEEVEAAAKKDAFEDRAGMLLYLKKDFDGAVLEGEWENAIKLYEVSEDERRELFKNELDGELKMIKKAQALVGDDPVLLLNMLKEVRDKMPQKNVVNLAGSEGIVLTDRQANQKSQIGYALAIITLGFLFCGVCVAHSVIEEQNNKVFTRVMLTKISERDYFISKFAVTVLICILQTLVLGLCLSFVRGLDLGIGIVSFLFVIFFLGLIFSTLSLLLGVVIGDVMSSNYAVFSIWSISALLAGLYFPLDDTTRAIKALSYLMPQRWFMDSMELLLTGDKTAYSMLLYITMAYLIVIISVGGVGLKIKRYE